MRKMLYLLLVVLFAFISCNASPEEEGVGLLRLVFEPCDDIASYSISISDKTGGYAERISVDSSDLIGGVAWTENLKEGSYMVSVEGRDQSGNVLLYGEVLDVKISRNTDSSIDMYLDVGVGEVELVLSADDEDHALSIVDDVVLERLSSNYSVSIDKSTIEDGVIVKNGLPAGQYLATVRYEITTQEGFVKQGEHLELFGVRNGERTTLSSSLSFGGKNAIVLEDEIGNPIKLLPLVFSEKTDSDNPNVDYFIPEKSDVVIELQGLQPELYTITWSISSGTGVTITQDYANPNIAIIYCDDLVHFTLNLLVEAKSGNRFEKGYISLDLESQAI